MEKKLVHSFLSNYEKDVINLTKDYYEKYGLGASIIKLEPGKEELDIEYYPIDNLNESFKRLIRESEEKNNSEGKKVIYYIIELNGNKFLYKNTVD